MYGSAPNTSAQGRSQAVSASVDESRPRTVSQKSYKGVPLDERPLNPERTASPSDEAAIQSQINAVYRGLLQFIPARSGDIVGIFIDKHPEDSVLRVAVSPVGRVYFPLLGDITVVGKTLPQLQEYLGNAVAEFIKEPRVTLALLEAQSAKIGILGDVKTPGVHLMTRPLRVLDGHHPCRRDTFDTGSANVSILRQFEDGRVQMLTADVKKILKGKASPEENAFLRPGDTLIVHGNLFKMMTKVSSLVGITSLVTLISSGRP